MLTASNLKVMRGSKVVLEQANLRLKPGVGHGLVGPNGAGKTSLLLALLGVIPASGEIERNYTNSEVGVVWQDRCLPLNVSVNSWLSYLSNVFGKPQESGLLERFNLSNDSRLIRSISGGEQQKLAITSAFFHNPKVLVLDEPTVGLDQEARFEFLKLCSERIYAGASILITSHNSSDISAVASEITILGGKKQAVGSLFTTSRELTTQELDDLAKLFHLESISHSSDGYLINSDLDIFSELANFASVKNFSVTSFSSIK